MTFASGSGYLEILPVTALRLDDEIVESLHHLGLETIGQLMDLPRDVLPARFGPILTLRLNQLLGHVAEPLVPLEPFSPIVARIDFEGAIDSLETVWIVFKKLIEQITRELLRRGRGRASWSWSSIAHMRKRSARPFDFPAPRVSRAIFSTCSGCAFETIETEEGFLGISLRVTRSERISEEQIHLLGDEALAGEIELAHLIERLSIRLGEQVIAQPRLVESHVPEFAYMWRGRFACEPATVISDAWAERPRYELRPLLLLSRPTEIGVMVSPSDDREGRPVSFNHRGLLHRIRHTVGPERIAGQWWQGHHKTRDYFDLEDEDGKRFWIFRVRETGKWFLHGEFE